MLIEFGNHASLDGDTTPKVTYVHVPEADEDGLGGYTFDGSLDPSEFKDARLDAMDRGGIFRGLENNEALIAIHNAWTSQSNDKPAWVNVLPHADGLSLKDAKDDLESFLQDHFKCEVGRPADLEDRYHTNHGAPGQGVQLAPIENTYTNSGRVISNINDGGGQVGATGTGTAATATTLTTASTYATNQWAGYRVYAMQTATGPLQWGNILSNTNAAGASVLTVDRWYVAATPGGAAATTPSAGYYFLIADGGQAAAWFVGMTITNISPAAADTTMSGEYVVGTPAGVAAGAGYLRKISPYAQTSGVSTRAITLIPVFTGNSNDIFPQTFYAISVNTSMVSGSAGCMKFETTFTSATVSASGDQITITETINGS